MNSEYKQNKEIRNIQMIYIFTFNLTVIYNNIMKHLTINMGKKYISQNNKH